MTCPYCGKPALSLWRKLYAGPAIPLPCRNCGRSVGVSWSSMIAYVPFAMSVLATLAVGSLAEKGAIILAGFVAMSVIHVLFAPMVRR